MEEATSLQYCGRTRAGAGTSDPTSSSQECSKCAVRASKKSTTRVRQETNKYNKSAVVQQECCEKEEVQQECCE